MMEFETRHDVIAWSNWLAQFRHSPKLEALVRSLYWGVNEAGRAAAALHLERFIETAHGAQLDGIGDIVGQTRIVMAGKVPFFGFEGQSNSAGFGQARFRRGAEADLGQKTELLDAEYRNVLRWKVSVNKGTGTAADVAEAINAVFDTDGTRIEDMGNAKIRIIVDVQIDPDNPLVENKDKWVATAAGVGFEFYGFREIFELMTEDNENLLTESGDALEGHFYAEA